MSFEREKEGRDVWTAALVSALAGTAVRDKHSPDVVLNDAEKLADAAQAKWQVKHFPLMERTKLERATSVIQDLVNGAVSTEVVTAQGPDRVFVLTRGQMGLLAELGAFLARP